MTDLEKYCSNESGYPCKEIISVNDFIKQIKKDTKSWALHGNVVPWFRGQSDFSKDPIPTIFRKYDEDRHKYYSREDEFWLATTFRNRAPTLEETPKCDRIDKWLFLMQHFTLPTRLLDWTESSLMALFFAVRDTRNQKGKDKTYPAVWMLHPIELNKMTEYLINESETENLDQFPNTWTSGLIGSINFEYAFTNPDLSDAKEIGTVYYCDAEADGNKIPEIKFAQLTKYPLAVQPTYVQTRMIAQKSVFTIHGRLTHGFEKLYISGDFKSKGKMNFLKKYVFHKDKVKTILKDLITSGITNSTIFPDFEGLAKELVVRFMTD